MKWYIKSSSIDATRRYDLRPEKDSRQSFYGKAYVEENDDGSTTLFSYHTPVMTRLPDGTYIRHWGGWSNTTGRHIYEFSDIRKPEWDAMEVIPY